MAESVARRRLAAQRLTSPSFRTPASVVSWFGAMQAQDYRGALWAIGIRMANATETMVERAVADRSIVRTWPMRGTLHFVAAADARWMLEVLGPRVIARNSKRLKNEFDLTPAVLVRAEKVVVKALLGGRQIQRDALYALLDDAGIETGNMRGLHIVFQLAHQRVICFGAREGKQHTFALFDEWLPASPGWTREEALAEAASRYFTSHGPATVRDFAWWSGLTAADSREALALAQSGLEHEVIEGRTYWFAAPRRATAGPAPRSWLLPAWDEYTVAYKDRSAVIEPAHRALAVLRNGIISPAIVMDGRVVGTWKRTIGTGQAIVTPSAFGRFTRADKAALLPAVRRYGRFLGVPAVLGDR